MANLLNLLSDADDFCKQFLTVRSRQQCAGDQKQRQKVVDHNRLILRPQVALVRQ